MTLSSEIESNLGNNTRLDQGNNLPFRQNMNVSPRGRK